MKYGTSVEELPERWRCATPKPPDVIRRDSRPRDLRAPTDWPTTARRARSRETGLGGDSPLSPRRNWSSVRSPTESRHRPGQSGSLSDGMWFPRGLRGLCGRERERDGTRRSRCLRTTAVHGVLHPGRGAARQPGTRRVRCGCRPSSPCDGGSLGPKRIHSREYDQTGNCDKDGPAPTGAHRRSFVRSPPRRKRPGGRRTTSYAALRAQPRVARAARRASARRRAPPSSPTPRR
jgi:hypothetical protein